MALLGKLPVTYPQRGAHMASHGSFPGLNLSIRKPFGFGGA